jgi:hypothetical protein
VEEIERRGGDFAGFLTRGMISGGGGGKMWMHGCDLAAKLLDRVESVADEMEIDSLLSSLINPNLYRSCNIGSLF